MFGAGGGTSSYREVEETDVIFLWGANARENHPIFFHHVLKAIRRGGKLFVVDPRRTPSAEWADQWLGINVGTDIVLAHGMAREIIHQGLANDAFIRRATEGFDAYRECVEKYTLEYAERETGVPAEVIRQAAEAFARADRAMICWTLGITEHHNAVDNVLALINLSLLTGHVGKYGSGVNPLRGQNNVQGGGDMGAIPNRLAGFQDWTKDPAVKAKFDRAWGIDMAPRYGKNLSEMFEAMDHGELKAVYAIGENPALSEADQTRAERLLVGLDHLVVQDIFMTETAWLADVVLPASAWPEKTGTVSNTDRMVQLGRRALELPGEARLDLWIVQQMARRLGLDWRYDGDDAGVAAVYEEMRLAMHEAIGGIGWSRLQKEGSVTYPCRDDADPGQPIVFIDRFATADGRLRLVPADIVPAAERPDATFPFVLITGRQLEHWHTGSMSRRARVLDALEPMATASLHGDDLHALGLAPGDVATVRSRRGEVCLHVRRDDGTPRGAVFIPFVYAEAAANLMTHAALDPVAKIPEFKYCAVAVTAGGTLRPSAGYGTGSPV